MYYDPSIEVIEKGKIETIISMVSRQLNRHVSRVETVSGPSPKSLERTICPIFGALFHAGKSYPALLVHSILEKGTSYFILVALNSMLRKMWNLWNLSWKMLAFGRRI